MGPKMGGGGDTKTNWPTDRRLQNRLISSSDICGFYDVGVPSLTTVLVFSLELLLGSSPRPAGLMTIFYFLKFEIPQPGGQGPSETGLESYTPQALGSPRVQYYSNLINHAFFTLHSSFILHIHIHSNLFQSIPFSFP
jgi:hypothetical protein